MITLVDMVSSIAGFIFNGIDKMNNVTDREGTPDTVSDSSTMLPLPKSWSLFEYLATPSSVTFDDGDGLFFTIPCGYELGDSMRYWFLRFELGSIDNVKEYFVNLSS